MNISLQAFLLVWGAASAIATGVFWGAYLLGKMMSRVERLEERVADHEQVLQEFRGA